MTRAARSSTATSDRADHGGFDIHTLADAASQRWQHRYSASPTRRSSTSSTSSTSSGNHTELRRSAEGAEDEAAEAFRSSGPSRHDRRASKACQACRARKTRCDGEQPKCSYCQKQHIECIYAERDLRKERPSKRRKSSSHADASLKVTTTQPSLQRRSSSNHQAVFTSPRPALPGSSTSNDTPKRPTQRLNATAQHNQHLANDYASAGHSLRPDQRGHEHPAPSINAGQHHHHHHQAHPSSTSSYSAVAPTWPLAAHSNDSHFLTNDLIEALSGKVAWFDEPERESNASANDSSLAVEHNAEQPPPWSSASDVAAFDPILADLLHQSSALTNLGSKKDRIIQLHYFRFLGGATAITRGLKKISIRIRVPPELESMLLEAQNRSSLFDTASAGLDLQTLNLHSLLGTSRILSANENGDPLAQTDAPRVNRTHSQDALAPSASPRYMRDLPDPSLRDLLLTRFFLRMGDHFPFISRSTLEAQLARGSQVNPALINAMCSLAARFVEPYELNMLSPSAGAGAGASVAGGNDADSATESGLGSSKPHSRGLAFAEKAKSYIMSSITVPSVTTVATLVLLAYHEYAVNSDSGLWMFAGMAIRMSIDLGLHRKTKRSWLAPLPHADVTGDLIEPRQLFWTIFSLDRNLCVGTGRPTSLKDREITLDYPSLKVRSEPSSRSASDHSSDSNSSNSRNADSRPSVFGYHVRLMQKAGTLAEIANNLGEEDDLSPLEELDKLEADMIADYDNLPSSLSLSEAHFRDSLEPRCLLSLHLWFYNLLMIMNRLPLSRLRTKPVGSDESTEILRHASQQIRNALLYANAADPNIHLGCPFTSQPFCFAGSFEASMAATLQRQEQLSSSGSQAAAGRPGGNGTRSSGKGTRSGRASPAPRTLQGQRAKVRDDGSSKGARSLFIQSHLAAYQRCLDALERQTETWLGTTYITNALKARKTKESHEVSRNLDNASGPSGSAETMLSYSELRVLLRLAASTVSSAEQAISIEDAANSSAATASSSDPSWNSPPAIAAFDGPTASSANGPSVAGVATSRSHAASSATSSSIMSSVPHAYQPHNGSFASATSGVTSMPQQHAVATAPFQHVEISDISHPDDLSHFLPFLNRALP